MDFEIAPKLLLDTLKRLMPHKSSLLRKGPLVTLHAEGDALDVIGQFENTWSVPALVHKGGRCTVDVVALMTPLKTYEQKLPIRFVLSEDGLRFGTTKMKLHKDFSV
jgi:hypothetical protein